MPLKPLLAIVPLVAAGLVWTAPAALAHDDHCPSAGQASPGPGPGASGSGGGHDGGRDGGHDCRVGTTALPAVAQPDPPARATVMPRAAPGGAIVEPDAGVGQAADGRSRAAVSSEQRPAGGAAAATAQPQVRRTANEVDSSTPVWTVVAAFAIGLALLALVSAGLRVRRQMTRGLDTRWPRA
jgi:hypothetical protein